jgi:tRNA(Ile)-lysidine synthase
VIVAHLDHQLRPTSAEEADFVRGLARRYGLEFVTGQMDVTAQAAEQGESIEEAARNARYRFLFDTAEKKQAAAVIVAHQADDQVETVLMNLLRGAGLNGLSAMQYCSHSAYHSSIPLIRPLLDCWREEIEAYCRDNSLKHVNDESNRDTAYRRNRIRLNLIPALEQYNPSIKTSLLRMSRLLGADKAFLDDFAAGALEKVLLEGNTEYAAVAIQPFRQYQPAVQRYIVRRILRDHFPEEKDFGAIHIEQARHLIDREMKALNTQLNDHVLVRVENERAVFLTLDRSTKPDVKWPSILRGLHIKPEVGKYALNMGWKVELEVLARKDVGDGYKKNPDAYSAYLDLDKLESSLELRVWQPGDRYRPLGMRGSQKLSDFWTNHKVPARAKDHWPLVFSGEKIAWIPGFQPAQFASILAETQRILKLRVFQSAD